VSAVTVTGTPAAIPGTAQFTAVGILADGTNQNLTSSATWGSSNRNVVTVSSAGVVTSVAFGSADITATVSNVSGIARVTLSGYTRRYHSRRDAGQFWTQHGARIARTAPSRSPRREDIVPPFHLRVLRIQNLSGAR
jgi:hypothetical protein